MISLAKNIDEAKAKLSWSFTNDKIYMWGPHTWLTWT